MDSFDRFSRFFQGTFFWAAQIECFLFNFRILKYSSPINHLLENADLHFGILLHRLATGLMLPPPFHPPPAKGGWRHIFR